MKVTKNQIKSLAQEFQYQRDFVEHVFNQMTIGNPQADKVGTAELKKQLQWCRENSVTSVEMYEVKINAIIEEVKRTSIGVGESNDEEEMRQLYKKLGYNNKEIRKVKIVEKHLRVQLKALITDFIAQATSAGIDLKSDVTGSNIFTSMDKRWREFARNYAIREYPKANTHKEIRARLTGLFEKKLKESLSIDNSKAKIADDVINDIVGPQEESETTIE